MAGEYTGSSRAIQMATEMVVATMIGFGIGYGLDRWLGTQPWLSLIFFIFGVAAGFINLFRAAYPEKFAYPPPRDKKNDPPESGPQGPQ